MLSTIVELAYRNELTLHVPPYAFPADAALVTETFPLALASLADPEKFVFTWTNSGARINVFQQAVYPRLTDYELAEAADYPIPHDKIIVQTQLPRAGGGEAPIHLWDVERTTHGYNAIPFVYANNTLAYFGTSLIFDRRHRYTDGTLHLKVKAPASFYALHDGNELVYHHHMLLRFFRTLCQPAVEIENVAPDERLNRARERRGLAPMPVQRVVRLPAEINRQVQLDGTRIRAPEYGLRASHFRRSHRRTLASGRAINVRSCIINAGVGAPAVPQAFDVEA